MPDPFSSAWQHHGHHRLLSMGSRLLHPFRSRPFRAESTPDRAVVHLSGEITSENAGQTGKALEELLRPGIIRLEIDLSEVTYLSSDGGAVFFMALRAARTRGTRVIATHVRAQARSTLEHLVLSRVFEVYDGVGPSCSSCGSE
ncbi:STAS domain-containing protein [Streptomyces sp. NPDC088794]|uniref:STAS domain-containing protein n=1 Tax=Streptomyces sp. NPDC088794 TaxID=3365902 RepID=UPI003814897D